MLHDLTAAFNFVQKFPYPLKVLTYQWIAGQAPTHLSHAMVDSTDLRQSIVVVPVQLRCCLHLGIRFNVHLQFCSSGMAVRVRFTRPSQHTLFCTLRAIIGIVIGGCGIHAITTDIGLYILCSVSECCADITGWS